MKVIYGLFFSCLIFLAALVIMSRFSVPGGYTFFSVITGSMGTTIPEGSFIITQAPQNSDEVSVNSVITFQQPGYKNKFITHRVVDIQRAGNEPIFITKGDANEAIDSWTVSFAQIKGNYLYHIPSIGKVSLFIQSPQGLILLVLLPVSILIFIELKSIIVILIELKLQKHGIV